MFERQVSDLNAGHEVEKALRLDLMQLGEYLANLHRHRGQHLRSTGQSQEAHIVLDV